METVLYNKEGYVGNIILNMPATGNQINSRLANELRQVCKTIGDDTSIRVVTITGSGDVFCNGDEGFSPHLFLSTDSLLAGISDLSVTASIADIEQPVIAVINGDAIGHGLEIALACDIRISTDDASLGMTQVRDGVMPLDGGTQRLPRAIGLGRALEMLLTGDVISSVEAANIGLIHRVVSRAELPNLASSLSVQLSAMAPVATRYAKEAVLKGMDMTLDQGMRLEMDLNLLLQTTLDRSEGIASFLERRTPKFSGK